MPTTSLLVAALLAVSPSEQRINSAIDRGLKRLAQAAENYPQNRQCFSCHHQSLPLMALNAAKRRGFKVDDKVIERQTRFTLDSFRPKLKEIAEGKGVGGANTTAAYALHTLEIVNHPADDVTEALARFLVVRQRADGSWPATTKRPPTEGSLFTSAALALRSLKHYTPQEDSPEDRELKEQMTRAIERGTRWLEKAETTDTEDRVHRLLALVAINAEPERITRARDELLNQQLANGSWAQLPDAKGDAYATGTVLHALRQAGLKPQDRAYRRGVAYLLNTQDRSGAWIVETRSRPVQTFFDNGDPGGKSQFISTYTTGWAVLALLEATKTK
jgi:N-acyl-D-amino-acid deacylase